MTWSDKIVKYTGFWKSESWGFPQVHNICIRKMSMVWITAEHEREIPSNLVLCRSRPQIWNLLSFLTWIWSAQRAFNFKLSRVQFRPHDCFNQGFFCIFTWSYIFFQDLCHCMSMCASAHRGDMLLIVIQQKKKKCTVICHRYKRQGARFIIRFYVLLQPHSRISIF